MTQWWLQTSPSWIASALLAVLITAISWKLTTRALITWRRESEAQAKPKNSTSTDVEQPLLNDDVQQDAGHQGGVSTFPEAGSALVITPVRIPSARQSFDDQYEHHAQSPMAYSALGSFTVDGRSAWSRYWPAQPSVTTLSNNPKHEPEQVLQASQIAVWIPIWRQSTSALDATQH